MSLADIRELESRGSTVHSHYDGRQIERSFYLKPWSAAPDVVEAMLGSVTQETEGGNWVRHFPAQHPKYTDCYCNEVKCQAVHPHAIANSPSIALGDMASYDTEASRYAHFMEQLNAVDDDPAAGAFLTASYRPLLSAYKPYADRHECDGAVFDWINPLFVPSVRTVPWPDGLGTVGKTVNEPDWWAAVPDEIAQPLNVPIVHFTVKRLFVGEVPYLLLDELMNTVNDASWPTVPSYYALPEFPKGTLRFDNYEVIKHASRASTHGCWYELRYHFSWLDLKGYPVYTATGDLAGDQGYADVTWNHALMRPHGNRGQLGWYFVAMRRGNEWGEIVRPGAIKVQHGPIFRLTNFDKLFRLNAIVA